MEQARITLQGEGIRDIVRLLQRKESIYYKYETKDVVILMDEEYYMRIGSTLMSVNILHFKDERTVEIEMIAGGGHDGSTFSGESWGAESKEVKHIALSIIELCNENNWEIVEVHPEGFRDSLEKVTVKKLMESVLSWFKKE